MLYAPALNSGFGHSFFLRFFCGLNICSIFYVPNIVICLFCLNHIRGSCILGFSCASYDPGPSGPTILVVVPESEPVSRDVAAKLGQLGY